MRNILSTSSFLTLILLLMGLAPLSQAKDTESKYFTSEWSPEERKGAKTSPFGQRHMVPTPANYREGVTHGFGFDQSLLGECVWNIDCNIDNRNGIAAEPHIPSVAHIRLRLASNLRVFARVNVPEENGGECKPGSQAEVVMATKGAIDNLFNIATVKTYRKGHLVDSRSGFEVWRGTPIIDVVGDENAAVFSLTSSKSYDTIALEFRSGLNLLGNINVYTVRCSNKDYTEVDDGVYVSSFEAHEQRKGTPILGFPSGNHTHNSAYLGLDGLVCCHPLLPWSYVLCPLSNRDAIAGDVNEATTLAKGVNLVGLASMTSYAKVNVPTYSDGLKHPLNGYCPAGSDAFVTLSSRGVIDNWGSFVTLRTFSGGKFQEKSTSFNSSLKTEPPIFTDGRDSSKRTLMFKTTKPYDTVHVSVSSVVSGLSEIDFYHTGCALPDAVIGEAYDFGDNGSVGGNGDGDNNNTGGGTGLPDGIDSDGDGLSDELENSIGSDPNSVDTDCDGRIDRIEYGQGASGQDTDGDGKLDILESSILDYDQDGIMDEVDADDYDGCETNPSACEDREDTDTDHHEGTDQGAGNGDTSGQDVSTDGSGNTPDTNTSTDGSDQDGTGTVPDSSVGAGSGGATDGSGTGSSDIDSDGDGLSDALEHRIGSDPKSVDTDCDGRIDGIEYGKGAIGHDTDGDGKLDILESSSLDYDQDGIPDERDADDYDGCVNNPDACEQSAATDSDAHQATFQTLRLVDNALTLSGSVPNGMTPLYALVSHDNTHFTLPCTSDQADPLQFECRLTGTAAGNEATHFQKLTAGHAVNVSLLVRDQTGHNKRYTQDVVITRSSASNAVASTVDTAPAAATVNVPNTSVKNTSAPSEEAASSSQSGGVSHPWVFFGLFGLLMARVRVRKALHKA